jgi:hypothetical protein
MRRRYLVIVRCGRNSLHRYWGHSATANWDLLLCPFQEIEQPHPECPVIAGDKWPGLHDFLSRNAGWRDYEYIWLPDDDILTDEATINRFFESCEAVDAQLAAPGLSGDSYYSYPMTMANRAFAWRRTTFVEGMVPCFRRSFLETALPSFTFSRFGTGWGLCHLWGFMLGYHDIFILDETPVLHTRPVGLARNPDLQARAEIDLAAILRGFDIGRVLKSQNGFETDGTYHAGVDGTFFARLLAGYEHLCARHPHFLQMVMAAEVETIRQMPDATRFERIRRCLALAPRKYDTISHGRPSLVSSVAETSLSRDPALEAAGGNDGLITGRPGFRTAIEPDPWWQVDLTESQGIGAVLVYDVLKHQPEVTRLLILLSDDGLSWREAAGRPSGGADGQPLTVQFDPPIVARYLRVQALGLNSLQLDQIEVFGCRAAPA